MGFMQNREVDEPTFSQAYGNFGLRSDVRASSKSTMSLNFFCAFAMAGDATTMETANIGIRTQMS